MGAWIKARFVGGPEHNRIICCARLNVIYTKEIADVSLCKIPVGPIAKDDVFGTVHVYFLCDFVSEGGARFSQYVHSSLMQDGMPLPVTYRDLPLPELPRSYSAECWIRLVGTKAFRLSRHPEKMSPSHLTD